MIAARARRATAVVAVVLPFAAAVADEPGFKLNRYDEDYGALRDAVDVAPSQRIKFMRIGETAYLSAGGELRERYDVVDAPRYGIGTTRDAYLLQRLLLHADARLDDRLRVFVQLGDEDAYGKNRPLAASDADRFDVANAFVDVRPFATAPLTVRAGRQELYLNATQRFVSVREGPNVRQSFDGVRLTWSDGPTRFEAFATRPVAYAPGSFDDAADRSQRFSGLYASFVPATGQTLDAYAFVSTRDAVRLGANTGDEHRQTFGLRWAGRREAVDFDVEGAGQTGRFAGRPIGAWALSAIVGYTWRAPGSPRAGFEVDIGSGDRGDGRVGTFVPLFPKGAYFNESSTVSWANLVALRPSLTIAPRAEVTLTASVLARWRQSGRDAVYVQPYVAIAPTLAGTARHVGETFQFDATWRVDRHLTLSAQALHATAGAAIRAAGGRPMDFAMAIGQYRF